MSSYQHLKLSELNKAIRDTLAEAFNGSLWIVAEIAKVTSNYSGHTYLDLVEKSGSDTLASARATIWRSNNSILAEYANVTGQPLKHGMQALLLVRVDFHPVYGLSLNVQQIDPTFALGEMARLKQEVIDRLQAEGLLERNASLALALVPQRIAVLTSITAAGWEDFQSRLRNNPYGYFLNVTLFPSVMQGDGAEASLMSALTSVSKEAINFDCVVIIRGGGGTVDLSCFDGYPLAKAIAQFPLPVITGVGHERDTSVADIAAYHRADTPTAAAEFLISRFIQFDVALQTVTDSIANQSLALLSTHKSEIADIGHNLAQSVRQRLSDSSESFVVLQHRTQSAVTRRVQSRLQDISEISARLNVRAADACKNRQKQTVDIEKELGTVVKLRFEREASAAQTLSNVVRLRDPQDVLRRGYTITRSGLKAIRSASQVVPGDKLEIQFADGNILSSVEKSV